VHLWEIRELFITRAGMETNHTSCGDFCRIEVLEDEHFVLGLAAPIVKLLPLAVLQIHCRASIVAPYMIGLDKV
jgi:hypothetical protein